MSKFLMWMNGFFIITNALLITYGESPEVNLLAAFACLFGFMAAWQMHEGEKNG